MTGMDEKGCSNLSAPVLKEGVMPLPLSQEQQVRGADSLSAHGAAWHSTSPQGSTTVLRDGQGSPHLLLQCAEKRH